jgi:hypothetical protein
MIVTPPYIRQSKIQFHAPVKSDICQPCSRQRDYRDSLLALPFFRLKCPVSSIPSSIGAFNSDEYGHDLLPSPTAIPLNSAPTCYARGHRYLI